jgi:putative acetyltransferase
VSIRRYRDTDVDAVYSVFYDAVHNGTGAYYNRFERREWARTEATPPDWPDRLAAQHAQVAVMEGRVVGFMSLKKDGYLDFAFVIPSLMGTGVAARLYSKLEDWAIDAGLTRLTTEASHLARSFFLSHDWRVLSEQMVGSGPHKVENFVMAKHLG